MIIFSKEQLKEIKKLDTKINSFCINYVLGIGEGKMEDLKKLLDEQRAIIKTLPEKLK